jgi:hypothetical protein
VKAPELERRLETRTPEETERLGRRLGRVAPRGGLLALAGELGTAPRQRT